MRSRDGQIERKRPVSADARLGWKERAGNRDEIGERAVDLKTKRRRRHRGRERSRHLHTRGLADDEVNMLGGDPIRRDVQGCGSLQLDARALQGHVELVEIGPGRDLERTAQHAASSHAAGDDALADRRIDSADWQEWTRGSASDRSGLRRCRHRGWRCPDPFGPAQREPARPHGSERVRRRARSMAPTWPMAVPSIATSSAVQRRLRLAARSTVPATWPSRCALPDIASGVA